MMKNHRNVAAAAVFAFLLTVAVASAQDFRRSYAIPAGSQISIRNISGDVRVVGLRIGSIEVEATRTGRDRDLVQIEDLSTANKLELKVKYPESCNCDASVTFEVRVPSGVDYNFDRLASVSGNVAVSDVSGHIRAESVSGDVTVAGAKGIVKASSVSGNVNAQMAGIEGTGEMKFSSVSGSVHVKAPGNANADVEMSTLSGTLDTDFPIEVKVPEHGPGKSARGKIGTGANTLRISSISGKVSLNRN